MLAWHNMWMAKHGRELAMGLKQAGEDVVAGRKSFYAPAASSLRRYCRAPRWCCSPWRGHFRQWHGAWHPDGGVLGLVSGGIVSYLTYRPFCAFTCATFSMSPTG
ncbi:MAG: hypothetical protein U1E15_11445 [Hyphomicrobiales bacterium]